MTLFPEENSIHILPCKIDYDGKAEIEKYFIVEKDNGALSASIRGRKLYGKEVKLKDDTEFSFWKRNAQNCVAKSSSLADSFVAWEHDKIAEKTIQEANLDLTELLQFIC